MGVAGTEKRRSTEPRNTVTIGVAATQDSTFDRREVGAQVTPFGDTGTMARHTAHQE